MYDNYYHSLVGTWRDQLWDDDWTAVTQVNQFFKFLLLHAPHLAIFQLNKLDATELENAEQNSFNA